MRNKVIICICFLIVNICLSFVKGQDVLQSKANVDSILKTLQRDRKWVPYPSYNDRDGWATFVGENLAPIIERGNKRLHYQWKVLVATSYLEYERSGDRNIMQNPNNENINALSDLVLAELAEGKGRFVDQIINGVYLQCERTSWVLSAHLPRQQSKRVLPDHTENVIDLGSANLGGFLAWTYYFLHDEFDKVDPIISKRLYDELYNKIIKPYRGDNLSSWMGYNLKGNSVVNNWNPWCNFNVLQCTMLLEDDPELLSKDIYRTMASVDNFINYIKKDGACEEGPSYWGHAAGKLYDFLKMLSLATGGEVSLFEDKLIRDMGEYTSRSYVGNNWVVNFADASAKFSADAGLIYRYGEDVNSPEMMGFASMLVKNGQRSLGRGVDMFRILESLAYDSKIRSATHTYSAPDITVYPETQFYYVKNANGFFMAAKGGHNGESHNHNDIGTVSLYYQDTPILIDAGVGTYTRQTFSSERYSIWMMRSNYHNLPTINGQEQKFGKEYKAKNTTFDKKAKTFSVDISSAYPSQAQINTWVRSYQLKKNELVIQDKFSLQKPTHNNQIHFMLWGNIDISTKGKVIIDIQGKKMELVYNDTLFEVELETVVLDDIRFSSLGDVRLSSVWGNEIYRLTLRANKLVEASTYQFIIRPV